MTRDVRTLGQELNVQSVLEGSVQGDELRVTTQLVNVAAGYHLWSEHFDRELGDVFTIEVDPAYASARAAAANAQRSYSIDPEDAAVCSTLKRERLDATAGASRLRTRINIGPSARQCCHVKLYRRAARRKRPYTCSDSLLLGRGEDAAVH
jgi:hypothetical protein